MDITGAFTMKNILMSIPCFLAGILSIAYNKPMAQDAIRINEDLQPAWLRLKNELLFARFVIVTVGLGLIVFGLAMAFGFID